MDTQGSVLEKIAKAINNAGREVDTSVISVDDGETVQLKLESHGTGEISAFTLLDRLDGHRKREQTIRQPPETPRSCSTTNARERIEPIQY